MRTTHLTDEEIQQMALNTAGLPEDVLAHARQCSHCMARAETYRLLFTAIEEQPTPAFDFDLHAAVMTSLMTPERRSGIKDLWAYFIVITAAIAGVIVIYFWQYVAYYFRGFATISLLLIAGAGVVMLGLLLLDMYKNYQRKMKMLELL